MRSDSPVLSIDALAAQLSQSLPVYVSSELISHHPKLGQLLESLTEHLTPTGVRTSTQQQLNNATSALNQARSSYMEQEALSHYMVSALRTSNSPKVLQPLKDAYALAELAMSVKLPFDAHKVSEAQDRSCHHLDVNVLADVIKASNHVSDVSDFSGSSSKSSRSHSNVCLSPGSSINHSTTDAHDTSAVDASARENCSCSEGKMCSDFVAALKKKSCNCRMWTSQPADVALCVTILRQADPSTHQLCSRRVLAERALRLSAGIRVPALLTQVTSDRILAAWHKIIPCILLPGEKTCGRSAVSRLLQLSGECVSSARLLHSCSVLSHSLLLQVDEQLVEYGEILTNLVKKRRLSDLPHTQLLHLCMTLHTQQHKLRCVELQLARSTYSPAVVAGLKSLSRTLQQRAALATEEAAGLQHQLRPYLQLDPSYRALLQEYNKLRADIQFCTSARK